MKKFDEIKADYQVTGDVKDIDMLRIIRENVQDGSNWIIISTSNMCILFISKKFAKTIENNNVFKIHDVNREDLYGFSENDDGSGETSYVKGNAILSNGFTKFRVFDVHVYDTILMFIKQAEQIQARGKKTSKIKVTAG